MSAAGEDNGRRAVLTADEESGFAVWITSDAPPVSEPLPAGVSRLLAADDALMRGRWGAHITLCGLEVRKPNATAAVHDDNDPLRFDSFHYCPECVAEARRWSAEPAQADRSSDPVR